MLQQLDTAIGFSVVMLMLSLLVMTGVQMISALSDLRGKNLVRALADLFHQIEPALRRPPTSTSSIASEILQKISHPGATVTLGSRLAEAVATHPTLSHTFARAKAIRQDELLAVLKDLCTTTTQGRIDDETKAALRKAVESRVPGGVATVTALRSMVDQLGARFPAAQSQVQDELKNGLQTVFGNVTQLETEVGKWFDTIMDRASDVFTRWTRVITVIITALLVIALHIDSGEILQQISANPELKASLVRMSDSTMAQADKAFDNKDRASQAFARVIVCHTTDSKAASTIDCNFNDTNTRDTSARVQPDPVAAILKTAPAKIGSCAEGREWIDVHTEPPTLDQLQQEFSKACEDQAKSAMGVSREQLRQISSNLKSTDLRIVPHEIAGKSVFSYPESGTVSAPTHCLHLLGAWASAYYSSTRHLLGTLASVCLLSLGAPFWFNALKQMSNLKPAITSKIEGES
jgi:hypothetical protein